MSTILLGRLVCLLDFLEMFDLVLIIYLMICWRELIERLKWKSIKDRKGIIAHYSNWRFDTFLDLCIWRIQFFILSGSTLWCLICLGFYLRYFSIFCGIFPTMSLIFWCYLFIWIFIAICFVGFNFSIFSILLLLNLLSILFKIKVFIAQLNLCIHIVRQTFY